MASSALPRGPQQQMSQLLLNKRLKHLCIDSVDEENRDLLLSTSFPSMYKQKWHIFVKTPRTLNYLNDKISEMLKKNKCGDVKKIQKAEERCTWSADAGVTGVVISVDPETPDQRINELDDKSDVSCIINYDLPTDPKTYLHRIDRSRVKRIVVSFATPENWLLLLDIQRFYKMKFSFVTSPPRNKILHEVGNDESTCLAGLPRHEPGDAVKEYDSKLIKWSNRQITDEVFEDFESLGLDNKIMQGIVKYGYKKPYEIQHSIIKPLCNGENIFLQADSEPGKWVAFCTWIVQKLVYDSRPIKCQCLVLVRTVWIAVQIVDILHKLSQQVATHIVRQHDLANKQPNSGFHVLIGDPRHLIHSLQHFRSCLQDIKMFVLDDADKIKKPLLVKRIIEALPLGLQVCVFSETSGMPDNLIDCSTRLLKPDDQGGFVRVVAKQDNLTLADVRHCTVISEDIDKKYELILKFLKTEPRSEFVIFTASPYEAIYVVDFLLRNGLTEVACMPDMMDQEDRNRVMREFNEGTVKVVVTDDVRALGLHLQASYVINVDMPGIDFYVGCVGRFGKGGGCAITFTAVDEIRYLVEIAGLYDIHFEELLDDTDLPQCAAKTPVSEPQKTDLPQCAAKTPMSEPQKRRRLDPSTNLCDLGFYNLV